MAISFNVTGEDIAYYPSDVPIPTVGGGAWPANEGPYFNWYRGAGGAPAAGRPAWVRMYGGTYVASTRTDSTIVTEPDGNGVESDLMIAEMLQRGCTFISASMTPVDTTLPYDLYSAGGVSSSGVHHPPGLVPSGLSVAPYNSVNYPMSYKDCIYLIQFLKKNASTYEINPNRIFVFGDSWTAHALQWAIYKERAYELGNPSTDTQYGFSTRVAAASFARTFVNWNAFLVDETGIAFPDAANANGVWTKPAPLLSDAPQSYKDAFSLLGTGSYGDAELIRTTPLYLDTATSAGNISAVNTVLSPPFTGLTQSEHPHSAWASAVLRKFVDRAPVRFACGSTEGQDPSASVPNEDFNYTDDDDAIQTRDLIRDKVAWFERYLLAGKPAASVRG